MTKKEVRHVLCQVRSSRLESERLLREIQQIRAELTAVKAIRYDTIRVQTSPENALERLIIKLDDRTADLEARIEDEKRAIDAARGLIRTCTRPAAAEALTRRYIDGQRPEKIADAMAYSEKHVFTLIRQGIAEIAERSEGTWVEPKE